jgi:hypothetical protein
MSLLAALSECRALVLDLLAEVDEPSAQQRRDELPTLAFFAGILVRADATQARALVGQVGEPHAVVGRAQLLEMIASGEPPADCARTIVEGYVVPNARASSRAHYNVACLYGNVEAQDLDEQVVRCRDRALSELELALADASLLRWAQDDPSLRRLQRERREEWAALVARHDLRPPPAAPSPAMPPAAVTVDDVLHIIRRLEFPAAIRVTQAGATDWTLVTEEGLVLVEVVQAGVATFDHVRSLAGERALIERAEGGRVIGAVLIVGPQARAAVDLDAHAERFGVRVVGLSSAAG